MACVGLDRPVYIQSHTAIMETAGLVPDVSNGGCGTRYYKKIIIVRECVKVNIILFVFELCICLSDSFFL